MERNKHKKSHVVIVTGDAEDAHVKQYRFSPLLVQVLLISACVIIGAVIGYFINEDKIRKIADGKVEEQKQIVVQKEEQIASLEGEIQNLEAEINNLNHKIEILSQTVQEKVEIEQELTATIEAQALPTEYPLTGFANIMETQAQEDPISVFDVSEGVTIVATASGTVIAINEDVEYGKNIWIDHDNGYVTIYRNNGDNLVKIGDTVARKTALFVVGEDNQKFGYQIMKDDVYIDPMEMLNVSG